MQHTVTCPNCGAVSAAGQRFCGKCGTVLVAAAQQVPTAPVQQIPAVPSQQVPAVPAQQMPTAPAQEVPAKVVSPVIPRQQVEVKPTWGLAWGLWWRMALLGLLIGGIIYLIGATVMVLAFNYQFPFGA
jgi:hypothetical protein